MAAYIIGDVSLLEQPPRLFGGCHGQKSVPNRKFRMARPAHYGPARRLSQRAGKALVVRVLILMSTK